MTRVTRRFPRHPRSQPRRAQRQITAGEYLLMIHPLVLGSGRRLFEHDDHLARLRLLSSTATTTDVILAGYQPA
jgi:dihydrofolate reductase